MHFNAIPTRGRFAPSPTGAIHLGNVWTALLAWLDVRQRGGAFVLRIEDLDPDRSKPYLAANLLADLRWLGLDWDEGPDLGGPYAPYVQDQRRGSYDDALHVLAERELVYCPLLFTCGGSRCCVGTAWPGAASALPQSLLWQLSKHERQAREAAGRRPSLRVRIPQISTSIRFVDQCCGEITEDVSKAAGDFVIRRRWSTRLPPNGGRG